MTQRQKHIQSVRSLINTMMPEQKAQLNAESLMNSYGLTRDEAEYMMREMGV